MAISCLGIRTCLTDIYLTDIYLIDIYLIDIYLIHLTRRVWKYKQNYFRVAPVSLNLRELRETYWITTSM